MNILKGFFNKAVIVYLFVVFICFFLYNESQLPFVWIIFGTVEVITFFYFSRYFIKKWESLSTKQFAKKVFSVSLFVRVLWVIFSYYFYIIMTGEPYEYDAVDALLYHSGAIGVADHGIDYIHYMNSSDAGYTIYLGILYSVFGANIIIPRLIKALISSYTTLLIFRLASRNFNENTGRITAIMCMLLPNLIYYCGLHLKETEMIFLVVFFIERVDLVMRTKKLNPINIILPLFAALSLFYFRTVLAATVIIAFLTAIIFTSNRILSIPRRLLFVLLTVLSIITVIETSLFSEVSGYWGERGINQKVSMIARSERIGGNMLASYGSTTVFLPISIPSPFPTLTYVRLQENIMLLNGAYFTKNVYAFFVFAAILLLIKRKLLKDHVLIVSFLLGYLIVISLSGFALSERFHLPAVPFLLILAGYGVYEINKSQIRYYNVYLLLIAILIIGWNWFKLAGRGIL